MLWLWLYFTVGNLGTGNILKSALKLIISALAAGSVAQVVKVLVWPFIDMTKFSGVFIQLVAASLAGLLVYAVFCYFLKSEELFGLLSSLKNKWPFRHIKIDDQGEAQGL